MFPGCYGTEEEEARARESAAREAERDELAALGAILQAALKRSPYDVGPCGECGEPVVCIPEGLALCNACAAKTEDT